jgi:hypothetical protein
MKKKEREQEGERDRYKIWSVCVCVCSRAEGKSDIPTQSSPVPPCKHPVPATITQRDAEKEEPWGRVGGRRTEKDLF